MKIEKLQHYTSLEIYDDNNRYDIQIQNDCSQLRIDPNNGGFDIFINTNKKELTMLRDMLTQVIESN